MLTFVISAITSAIAAPQSPPRNWTQTAVNTPVGWRVGNPGARIKLVEYGSLNCPHCAHDAEFAFPQIMAAVKSGAVSFEFRPFLIFPHDVSASLIARCVPVARRFGFVESYYGATGGITDKLRAADKAELEAARAQGPAALNRKMVSLGGMQQLSGRYGLTPAATSRCVSDKAGLDWLQAAYGKAREAGVTGTPTYFINGKRVQFQDSAELAALLK